MDTDLEPSSRVFPHQLSNDLRWPRSGQLDRHFADLDFYWLEVLYIQVLCPQPAIDDEFCQCLCRINGTARLHLVLHWSGASTDLHSAISGWGLPGTEQLGDRCSSKPISTFAARIFQSAIAPNIDREQQTLGFAESRLIGFPRSTNLLSFSH